MHIAQMSIAQMRVWILLKYDSYVSIEIIEIAAILECMHIKLKWEQSYFSHVNTTIAQM